MPTPKIDLAPYAGTIQRAKEVRYDLETFIFERRSIIKAVIVALLAKEHMLLVGPPGVAKSMIVSQLTRRIVDANLFEILMHAQLRDRDLFVSSVDIESQREISTGVEKLRIVQHTDGDTLGESHVAFLDEVYKSSPKILNTLLTLLNERMFDIDRVRHEAKLMSAFFASNELPELDGPEGLAAFHDRILIRAIIDPIKERENQINIMKTQLAHRRNAVTGTLPAPQTITLAELQTLQDLVPQIYVPEEMMMRALDLKEQVQDEFGGYISDRRIERSCSLLQAKALLNGRNTVEGPDLSVLRFVLWTQPEEYPQVEAFVKNKIYEPWELEMKNLKEAGFDAFKLAKKQILDGNLWGNEISEHIRGIEGCIHDLDDLAHANRGKPGFVTQIEELKRELLVAMQEVQTLRAGVQNRGGLA